MIKETYTTFEISQFCNVFITTVSNWVDEGKLPAYRTPGGHRRVKRQDLLIFLEKYGMPVPHELLESQEKKILIVDDNPETVEMLKSLLKTQNANYIIRTADNGFEAGKQVVSFHPDLLILDVVLPGWNGIQVCQNLRRDPATRDIRVIVMTGHDGMDSHEEFMRLKVDAFMEKPFEIPDFSEKVKDILDSSQGAAVSRAEKKSA